MQLPVNAVSFSDTIAKLPQQKIAKAITVLLMAYIAYLLAQITWLALSPTQVPSNIVTNVSNNKGESSFQSEKLSIQKLQSLHLFGKYNEKPVEQTVEEVKDAPETKLNLTLSATVASDDSATSAAVIENGGKQETYGIGDKISNTRATLEQVLTDRVIIKQSGRLETLMLDGFEYGAQAASSKPKVTAPKVSAPRKISAQHLSSPNVVDQRQNKQISAQASSLKKDLLNNPGKITDYLKISPKRKDGKIFGYQLRPGKSPDFFNAAGLKLGDVAIQMNGFDLSEPSEAAQALQALRKEKEVSLQVSRNDEITEILFSIDN
ncbi:type II secretion system protein GspC [Thalassotalea sp. PLHSN55]|uniref:type II secretion system protein GspC n=1 Tax=Thalassotalea sp. PLHSN55 TaxID=3435888 RepID=UPI003F82E78D